jgi:hypothetical protein
MGSFSRSLAATLIVASVVAPGAARSWAGAAPTPPAFRLPADVAAPVRYRLELTAIPEQDTFTGSVEIDLRFAKSTPILWLNAEKLTVKQATLTTETGKVDTKIIAEPKNYIGFVFAHPVGPGAATLRVSYQGEISRKDSQANLSCAGLTTSRRADMRNREAV